MTRLSRPRLCRQLAVLAVATTVLSCNAVTPAPEAAAAAQLAKVDPSQIPLAEYGQLPVFVTWQTTDGRNIHLRGVVANPYPETIEGIRFIFRVFPAPPSPGIDQHELDRLEKTTENRLASGEQAAVRLDMQTMYAGQGGLWGFDLEAFAIKRAGRDLQPPPGWRE